MFNEGGVPDGWPQHDPAEWGTTASQAAVAVQALWHVEGGRFWESTAKRQEAEEGQPDTAEEQSEPSAVPPEEGASSAPLEAEVEQPALAVGGSEDAVKQGDELVTTASLGVEVASPMQEPGDSEQSFQPLDANTCLCCEALVDMIEVAPDWASADVREHTIYPIKRLVDDSENLDPPAEFVTPFLASAQLRIWSLKTKHFDLERDQSEALKALSRSSGTLLLETTLPRLLEDTTRRLDGGQLAQAHPFELLAIVRALSGCTTKGDDLPEGQSKAIEDLMHSLHGTVQRVTEELLARQQLRPISYAESVALAFCAAAASYSLEPQRSYIEAALRAAVAGQDASGQWPLGRSFSVGGVPDTTAEVPTHAVAAALSQAARWLVTEDRFGPKHLPDEAIDKLLLSAEHATASQVVASGEVARPPEVGWGHQNVTGQAVVESTTSAAVLQSMINLKRLSDAVRNQQTLVALKAIDPRRDYWPSYLQWNRYRSESEPDGKRPILDYLNENVVEPRKGTSPWSRVEPTSVLLFGPPGTTKTTIVRAVSHGLGWPLVSLSPGNFINQGLEMIEAQASLVFEQLHALSGAVVLFDECDELFRGRSPIPEQAEMRGIGAFTTASMLPKLQDLYDRGQVVFFVLTNFLRSIDPAIKRSGRIEHIVGVGPPDPSQREIIIRQKFSPSEAPFADAAIKALTGETERFVRGELVLAAKRLAQRWDQKPFENKAEAMLHAKTVADGLREGLSVTPQMYNDYIDDAKRFSMAQEGLPPSGGGVENVVAPTGPNAVQEVPAVSSESKTVSAGKKAANDESASNG